MAVDRKNRRVGFDSPFKVTYTHWVKLKNEGFAYEENLMNKTMGEYMLRNPIIKGFLQDHIRKIVVLLINSVKHIRTYYNYAVPKDYKKID